MYNVSFNEILRTSYVVVCDLYTYISSNTNSCTDVQYVRCDVVYCIPHELMMCDMSPPHLTGEIW